MSKLLAYKNEKYLLYFFIIIFSIIKASKNILVFPFKSTNLEIKLKDNEKIDDILFQLNKNQLYTSIGFGIPTQNIDFFLSIKIRMFSVLKNYCTEINNSTYIPEKSKRFNPSYDYNLTYSVMIKGKSAEDSVQFNYDLNLKDKRYINDFPFLIGYSSINVTTNNKYCGVLGLYHKLEKEIFYFKSLISYLKSKREIDSYSWGIFYFDKENSYNINANIKKMYDGDLIIGIKDEDYLNIFNTSNVISDYAIENGDNYIGINFQKIFFYNNKEIKYICNNNTLINFVIDNNYNIINTYHYNIIKENFFKKYISSNICLEKTLTLSSGLKEYLIICNPSMKDNLKYFPTLYFFNIKFEYTFNLDYNDLFIEINNKIYFLIVGKDMESNIWNLGKIFMKKYPFIFNEDKKTISFVYLNKFVKKDEQDKDMPNTDNTDANEKSEENNSKVKQFFKDYYLLIILIICVILGIIFGIYIGAKIWKKRRVRANELDDNVDYTENENNYKHIIN